MDEDFGWDAEMEAEWREYLHHFREKVYPLFEEFGVSFDTALSVWFVNRLRNTMPDDDLDDEPWRD